MIKIVSKNLIREDKVDEFKSLMKELVEKSSAQDVCFYRILAQSGSD